MTQRDRPTPGRRPVLIGLSALGLTGALGLAAQEVEIALADMKPGDFTWHPERSPEGPVAIVVSIPEQRVHVYRNGIRIAVSTCSTGKKGHETPTGVFTILQKDRNHRSSTYNDAPMPNMNRLTWDGVALHAGNLPGYPASHGCVRLPTRFSGLLFTVTHVGTPVIIAGSRTDPWELTHPGMLLDPGSETGMETAVASLKGKAIPSDWSTGAIYPVTTVLVTSADRKATLIENGRAIMSAGIAIDGSPRLGEHVLIVKGAADGALQVVGLTHHHDPDQPLAPESAVVGRLRVPADFSAAIAARMHPGMTIIISDIPASPDRQTGEDFVIMAADDLGSRVPRPRPEGLGRG